TVVAGHDRHQIAPAHHGIGLRGHSRLLLLRRAGQCGQAGDDAHREQQDADRSRAAHRECPLAIRDVNRRIGNDGRGAREPTPGGGREKGRCPRSVARLVPRAMRLALVLLLVLLSRPAMADRATLLVNGRILTDAPAPPGSRFAAAALVVDGRFAAVGTLRDVEAAARARRITPERVDLGGRFAVPALTDAHGHVEGLGQSLERLQLVGTRSAEAIAALVAERARTTPAGRWILGRGWDQNDWPVQRFPPRGPLGRVASDRPVWLRRVDGHAAWANSKALELAGVTKATADVPGGRIERAGDGSPTGVFVDNAMSLIETKIPPPTRA